MFDSELCPFSSYRILFAVRRFLSIFFENDDVTAGSIYEKVILAGFIDTFGAGICGGKVGFQIAAHSVIVQGKALIIRKI